MSCSDAVSMLGDLIVVGSLRAFGVQPGAEVGASRRVSMCDVVLRRVMLNPGPFSDVMKVPV